MPITVLKAPTLAAVENTIRALEKEFNIDSNKFESGQAYASIPDGAAEEWTYALEQRRALASRVHAHYCAQSYWKTTTGSQTRNDSERPNYAEGVAA